MSVNPLSGNAPYFIIFTPGGPWLPIVETRRKITNVVVNCRKIVRVVGNCQSCRRGGGGGGGGEDLKCCRPENFLVCRKIFSVCRKSTALGPPKNMGPTAPLGNSAATQLVNYNNLSIKPSLSNKPSLITCHSLKLRNLLIKPPLY